MFVFIAVVWRHSYRPVVVVVSGVVVVVIVIVIVIVIAVVVAVAAAAITDGNGWEWMAIEPVLDGVVLSKDTSRMCFGVRVENEKWCVISELGQENMHKTCGAHLGLWRRLLFSSCRSRASNPHHRTDKSWAPGTSGQNAGLLVFANDDVMSGF